MGFRQAAFDPLPVFLVELFNYNGGVGGNWFGWMDGGELSDGPGSAASARSG